MRESRALYKHGSTLHFFGECLSPVLHRYTGKTGTYIIAIKCTHDGRGINRRYVGFPGRARGFLRGKLPYLQGIFLTEGRQKLPIGRQVQEMRTTTVSHNMLDELVNFVLYAEYFSASPLLFFHFL